MYAVVKGTQGYLARTPWSTVLIPLPAGLWFWFNTALAIGEPRGFISQVAIRVEPHFWSGDYGLST